MSLNMSLKKRDCTVFFPDPTVTGLPKGILEISTTEDLWQLPGRTPDPYTHKESVSKGLLETLLGKGTPYGEMKPAGNYYEFLNTFRIEAESDEDDVISVFNDVDSNFKDQGAEEVPIIPLDNETAPQILIQYINDNANTRESHRYKPTFRSFEKR